MTETERNDIIAAIKAESQDPRDLPEARDLQGVSSLPGIKDGTLVQVPLTLIQGSAGTAAVWE